MLRNVALIVLNAGTLLISCGGDPGEKEKSQLHIIGGKRVDTAEYNQYFSSVVSLQHNGQHICGGTLVRANKVLTAAHCLVDLDPGSIHRELSIIIGARDIRFPAQAERFSIDNYSINPRYNAEQNQYDSATITLSGKSSFPPASVNRAASYPAPGTTVYLAGWGATHEGGPNTSILKTASVKTVANADCAKVYGSDINSGSLCAYADGMDSCQGDSGGPVFSFDGQKMTLVGIVSWGNGCARKGYPGVYTRTAFTSF